MARRPIDRQSFKLRSLRHGFDEYRARRPRREHHGRLRAFGVEKKRHLVIVPILVILIALTALIRTPERRVTTYQPAGITRANPLMGWAVDATTDPDAVQLDHSLVYARLTWRDFEPEKGVYDFAAFEEKNHLDRWWQSGKRLIIRFVMDVPGDERHIDIPDWLMQELGDEAGTYYENDMGVGFSPNYMNQTLVRHHRDAIRALGERYDGHEGVAFVELGSLGHNGGWQTVNVLGDFDMPPSGDLRTWVWAYTSAFHKTPLMAAAPYQPVRLTGIGLYNDYLGDNERTWDWIDTIEYGGYDELTGSELRSMRDFSAWAPSGAHIPEDIDQEELFGSGMAALLRVLRASHTTYVGGAQATDLDPDQKSRMAIAQSTMGYRLWVRDASWPVRAHPGNRVSVDITMQNDGVQAFSQPWPVELALMQGEAVVYREATELSAQQFATGSTFVTAIMNLPVDLPPGRYRLALSILDPSTGEPAVELALSTQKVGLRSVLGEIAVK